MTARTETDSDTAPGSDDLAPGSDDTAPGSDDLAPGSDAVPDEEQFRREARAWLAANAPAPLPDDVDRATRLDAARGWQNTLFLNGWAGISWPVRHGGRGLPGRFTRIFQEEEAQALDWLMIKAPFNVAFHMAVPALLAYGSEFQQDSHVPALLRGDELWCQLFSEPDAGSDLANLSTSATADGDEWVINGQKVWSSYAHFSDFGLLLARTDPGAPKHRGISYFVVDMTLPGITVKPLRQMTGTAEFNEVFFDDVRLSADSLLGEVNAGWTVAHQTLKNERQYLGVGVLTQPKYPRLLEAFEDCAEPDDPAKRRLVVDCYMREQILRFSALRVQAQGADGANAAIPSLMKLAQTDHVIKTAAAALSMLPTAALGAAPCDGEALTVRDTFLMSPAMRIGGGTDDIQRQTIAERILGLPREDDPGRKLPWRETRRADQRS